MPITNIQYLDYNDSQSDSIDKLNYNFDEIIEANGGTQGITGPVGDTGPAGRMGPVGNTGATGIRGNRWFVNLAQPSGPYNTVMEGDFWIDSNNGKIYVFNENGWTSTGYSLSSEGSIFRKDVVNYVSGGTGFVITFDQNSPQNYLFIVADDVPESGILNEDLSKFVISTDVSVNDSPILEFSKSNVESGSVSDYSKHPIFRWKNFSLNDNSLVLEIPGGSFVTGVSGGFQSRFNNLFMQAPKGVEINYGIDSNSGIFSTGGFSMNATNEFKIRSAFMNITGGSGYINAPVNLTASLTSTAPSIYTYNGGKYGFRTSRSADTFQALSNSVYAVSLESSSEREFYINTKGKIKTKKIETGISYASSTPGATSSVSSNFVNWYLISRTSTPVSSAVLQTGNTIVINPTVPSSSYIGIGIYSASNYSWGTTGGLDPGQSIDINVHYSPTSVQSGFTDGIKYIGKGATSGDVSSVISLPFSASNIDFTVSRGVTGDNKTTVFYRAYGPTGGYGGSFNI